MPSLEFLLPPAITLCIAIYVAFYLWGIRRGTVKPILATWGLFAIAVILSFITDLSEYGVQGIAANFFNLADSFAVFLILAVILLRKDTRRTFTLFEKWCIGASLLMALVWLVSGQNVLVHLSVQLILVIAYVPTLQHLWSGTQNTESLPMWFFDFLASFLGVIEPLRTGSLLPTVYGIRAVICTFLVMIAIVTVQYKKNRTS